MEAKHASKRRMSENNELDAPCSELYRLLFFPFFSPFASLLLPLFFFSGELPVLSEKRLLLSCKQYASESRGARAKLNFKSTPKIFKMPAALAAYRSIDLGLTLSSRSY